MEIRWIAFAVVLASLSLAAPSVVAHGNMGDGTDNTGDNNNGGGQRHHRHHGGDNNNGGGNGNEGPRHRHHGGGGGEGGVDVGVGIGSGPGYGRGRIGPPTECEELAYLRNDLDRLWRLRAQVNSGKRIVVQRNGHQVVQSTRGWRHNVQQSLTNGNNPGNLQYYQDLMDEARENSLATVDAQIGRTQARIAQLEYDCN